MLMESHTNDISGKSRCLCSPVLFQFRLTGHVAMFTNEVIICWIFEYRKNIIASNTDIQLWSTYRFPERSHACWKVGFSLCSGIVNDMCRMLRATEGVRIGEWTPDDAPMEITFTTYDIAGNPIFDAASHFFFSSHGLFILGMKHA